MGRRLASAYAGKATNALLRLGVPISLTIPVATPNGVDCTCTGNVPHQAPVFFNRKDNAISTQLMLGSVMMSFQEE
jgi:hypothetical protein